MNIIAKFQLTDNELSLSNELFLSSFLPNQVNLFSYDKQSN